MADHLRRLAGTAIAFTSFGIGGTLLGLSFPLISLFTPAASRRAFARRAVSQVFMLFLRWMRFLGIMEWHIEGQEKLGRAGQLVIANHPSLLDVVFLMAHMREANCVVKHSLWRNPCMVGPISAAGFIPNDEAMIERGVAALQSGDCLVMFPEGTRTRPGQPLDFQRGAASMAVKGAQSLTPVTITVTPTTLTKSEKWYRIPPRRFVMTLHVSDDIALDSYRTGCSMPVAARRLNADLTQHYARELQRG